MTFAVCGGRKTIISEIGPAQSPPAVTQDALLKALARAFRWRRQIENGEYAGITELARAQGVNESYACRLLRLTLLAPPLVEYILNGRQDAAITLGFLSRPVPTNWNDQIELIRPRL
jgi:hypothetical protein